MRFTRNDTAVLVVDYQERLMPVIAHKDEIIARSCILLEGLKTLGIPMVLSEQYPKGLGATVPEIRSVVGETQTAYPKTTFSCWGDEAIRAAIEETGCSNVIVCGAETHICVLQSAIDMKDAGKHVVLIEDCVGSRYDRDKETGLRRAEQEGIRISSTEAILFELLGKAGSAEFKVISKLIK